MIQVAAVGDVHLASDVRGRIRPHLADISEHADVTITASTKTRSSSC
jgi:hypothetical protein